MKKIFITLAFIASAFFCQAQFFLGGNLGFDIQNGKVNVGSFSKDLPKTTTFIIAPNVGYMFSDMWGAGIELGYALNSTKEKEEVLYYDPYYNEEYIKTVETTTSINVWTIAPYLRCVFAKFDQVNLYADLKFAFAGGSSKFKESGTTKDGPKIFNMDIGIVPGITYNLNEHISLNANLNLLSLGYKMSKTTEVDPEEKGYGYPADGGEIETVTTENNFGIGINYPTLLTVGFFYNF